MFNIYKFKIIGHVLIILTIALFIGTFGAFAEEDTPEATDSAVVEAVEAEDADEDADEDYWDLAFDFEENFSLSALRKHTDRIRIVRNFAKKNEETIKILHEGLQRPKANFHVDYENLDIPEICKLMNISKICWHHINLAMLDNDFEQAEIRARMQGFIAAHIEGTGTA